MTLTACPNVFSQFIVNDTTIIYGKIKGDYTALQQSPNSYSSSTYLSKGDLVFVYSYEKSNLGKLLYSVFKDTLHGYVKEDEIELKDEFEKYLKSDEGTEGIRKEYAELNAKLFLLNHLENEVKLRSKYKKIGLVITSKKFAFAEYGSQFGLKLSFYNGYNKDIKYIDLTIRPYNRVGDKTYDDLGKDVARVQVIGPLVSDMTSSVEFDSMFWDDNDIITYLVITYMKVTFMDGTVKEIKEVNKHLGKDVFNGKK